MYKQLIFCLETNKQAATDWIYISETLNHFFIIDNQIKLSQIYMGSKSKFNSSKVCKEIAKKINDYTLGSTHVLYCVDVDNFEKDPNHVREFDEIAEFCEKSDYKIIWFCHDIEDVFCKKRIVDHNKVKEASSFRQQKAITKIDKNDLSSVDNHQVHTSNLFSVLNLYLTEKYNG